MQSICKAWRVTEKEYQLLETQFGKLAEKQAWILLQKNYRNNHTEEQIDIAQEMRLAMIKAAAYHKRQVYIEKCLELCETHAVDQFTVTLVSNLKKLWKSKKRKGRRFGPYQEKVLSRLMRKIVPQKLRARKKAPLQLDEGFIIYCKAITWNATKQMGKRITREKRLRSSQVSLSEFNYWAED